MTKSGDKESTDIVSMLSFFVYKQCSVVTDGGAFTVSTAMSWQGVAQSFLLPKLSSAATSPFPQ